MGNYDLMKALMMTMTEVVKYAQNINKEEEISKEVPCVNNTEVQEVVPVQQMVIPEHVTNYARQNPSCHVTYIHSVHIDGIHISINSTHHEKSTSRKSSRELSDRISDMHDQDELKHRKWLTNFYNANTF